MKRILIIGILGALFAGCGVNETPEVSDIKKSLEDQFAGCKYIKFNDVEKLNGRELSSGRYAVSQKYTVEILPLGGYASDLEKIERDQEKVNGIGSALKAEIKEREKRIKAEIEQLNSELAIAAEAHEERLKRAVSDVEVHDETARYKEAQLKHRARWEELDNALESVLRSYSSELSAKLAAAGYSDDIDRDLAIGLRKMQQRAVNEFDSSCNRMSSTGRSIALQIAGYDPISQMRALAKGHAKEFSETVTYTKTEKGWIR